MLDKEDLVSLVQDGNFYDLSFNSERSYSFFFHPEIVSITLLKTKILVWGRIICDPTYIDFKLLPLVCHAYRHSNEYLQKLRYMDKQYCRKELNLELSRRLLPKRNNTRDILLPWADKAIQKVRKDMNLISTINNVLGLSNY